MTEPRPGQRIDVWVPGWRLKFGPSYRNALVLAVTETEVLLAGGIWVPRRSAWRESEAPRGD